MDVATIDIVFRCVIAEQTQIEKICDARQEFEWSKVSLVEGSRIGPHPANAIFFQKPDDLRPVPSGMTKFNREAEIPRQLFEKFAQRWLAIFWCKGWGELDENDLELWCERFDGAEKRMQLGGAIAQPAGMRDLARKLTREAKSGGSHLEPTADGVFGLMHFVIRAVLLFAAAILVLPEPGVAAVVFQPGEKAKFVAPGDEEISGNAAELFQIGQTAEKEGDAKRAIRVYKTLVRRHPKDALAAGALYRTAELQEQLHLYVAAAGSFSQLVEKYPSSAHFDEAIEAQFRIGEIYLTGKKLRFLGIPYASSLDRAVTIFANVVRTAPYGKYTARAQFDIGLAREKQGANDAALQAYQAVVDKFPNEPVAVDAQYQ